LKIKRILGSRIIWDFGIWKTVAIMWKLKNVGLSIEGLYVFILRDILRK